MKKEGNFKLSVEATPAALISYAKWYIGRLEKKGNVGFYNLEFEKEMVAAGWRKGDAWCATFAKMVFRKLFSGELLVIVNRLLNPGAKSSADNMRRAGIFETGTVPEPGAIVYFTHGHGPSGHAGIVTSVDFKTNTMYCAEGNTNASGSREGDRVAEKPRTINRPFSANGLNVYLYVYPRLKN
jgi:hypothetical protein